MQRPASVPALLARQHAKRPDAIAFIDGNHRITYREFDRLCRGTAAWLAEQGIGEGDRVAVWLVNRIEWLAMYFALSHLGAVLVTVNTRYRAHELAHILEHSRARMLVLELNFRKIDFFAVLAGMDEAAAAQLERIVIVRKGADALPERLLDKPVVAFDLDALNDGAVPSVAGSAQSSNIIFTTSGTTSGPKLVVHTQYSVTTHAQHVARSFGLEDDGAKLLATLPFCGVFGFDSVLGAFAGGCPVVLQDTFDAADAVKQMIAQRITHVFGSDEMFRRIMDAAPTGDRPFPSLRLCCFAAFHPGTQALGEEAWRRHIPMAGLYGSSEVQALFSFSPVSLPLTERLKGGGMPCNPDAHIRVRDVETGELLSSGQTGLLEFRADTNFAGYLDNPEANRKAIDEEGYFRSGDVGYLRGDGSFVYLTRHGDAIRLAGFLVDPTEIENELKQQPGVADAQVVAADVGTQVRCAAFVIMAPGAALDEERLKSSVAGGLAAFKVPAYIWQVDRFPTTQSSNGVKIQRAKLRDMARERIMEKA
ncbi:AMP-binding protein [Allopusillimonas soli]|uniref:Long-chain-fatty-acid--CoA ligase n=1 Tax=Allopusillimonas soli TaxID=659016 RepID=A0A853F662_9BURK|nr:AMP-binding protein [Allopusillimonas soli]NYT35469.1 AMP-binding protein [Allopusillimonas soli]